ncbi:MAG: sugar phosphate isomerase/epimerase [Chloroflexi bacterium]|nr:sugar phosphate isomerase/epimerase [Chloroflexota bacterium]
MRRKPLVALSTGSLHCYGLARVFALAKLAGFEGVEIMADDRWDTRHPDYLRSLVEAHEMPIVGLHTPFVESVPGWGRDMVNRVKRTVEVAEALAVPTVVAHLPLRWGRASLHVPSWGKTVFSFRLPFSGNKRYRHFLAAELADLQASTAVTIAVENMPHERFLGRPVSCFSLNSLEHLERFPSLAFDTTHFATAGIDILQAYDRLAPQVAHVHLSNYSNGREHQLLTKGELPLGAFLQRLRSSGYESVITVELSPESLEASNEWKAREHLRTSYRFCRSHLDQDALDSSEAVTLSAPS